MLKIGAVEKKRQTNNMNVDFPYAQYLSYFRSIYSITLKQRGSKKGKRLLIFNFFFYVFSRPIAEKFRDTLSEILMLKVEIRKR